jgi:hypothetical protein
VAAKKPDQWFMTLDELLQYPPEEVLAIFVHDFRNVFAAMQSSLDLLTDEEFKPEEPDRLIEMMKISTSKGYNGLDIMLAYLEARHDLKNADDKTSQ